MCHRVVWLGGVVFAVCYQVELARVIMHNTNEIRGDTGPILTQHDGYRGKDTTLYDELYDFYQAS